MHSQSPTTADKKPNDAGKHEETESCCVQHMRRLASLVRYVLILITEVVWDEQELISAFRNTRVRYKR